MRLQVRQTFNKQAEDSDLKDLTETRIENHVTDL